MKKALILIGNLVQDHEFIYPYYRVQEEGFSVDVAVRGKELVYGIIGSKIMPTKDIPELNIDDYDILILPGGAKSMEYMRQDSDILKFISDFNSSGKVIASICHAAQLLISAKVVEGKKISGYYSIKDDIINSGAEYYEGAVIEDSNIISSPHYKYLGDWMKKILNHF